MIRFAVYDVYERCSISRLPFDCINLITQLGYSCIKYSELKEESYAACMLLSEDAYVIDNQIFYNDRKVRRRVRFSLMHELGHLILDTHDEVEANNFASNILAPSMPVYYSKLRNVREISNLFDISLECAKYAYETCEKWLYSVKNYCMTDIDRKIYNHFYDEEANRFVFKKSGCAYCDDVFYDSNNQICPKCDNVKIVDLSNEDQDFDFKLTRNQWLYGGL